MKVAALLEKFSPIFAFLHFTIFFPFSKLSFFFLLYFKFYKIYNNFIYKIIKKNVLNRAVISYKICKFNKN